MVLSCDCSDTYSFGCIVLAQLADTHSFADDKQLIQEPLDSGAYIFDCKAARPFLKGILESLRSLGDNK
jgi:hypothetical protein